jgi:pre-mRNA-splicing factor ATP-dependent RNA helicase DHX16
MRRARDIKEQLIGLCERVEIDINDKTLSVYEDEFNTNIRKCIASGFFFNASKLQGNGLYRTVKNAHSVMIHPSSFLFKDQPQWVVYHELVFTNKEYMRNVVEIKPEWLTQIAPHFYKDSDIN